MRRRASPPERTHGDVRRECSDRGAKTHQILSNGGIIDVDITKIPRRKGTRSAQ